MHDVVASWCHNGSQHVETFDKGAAETNNSFAERVGRELTAKLKQFPVTNDC
jgi:hypothetical protein